MEQLNPQDAQFLYMETGNNLTHVTGASIYDPSTAPGGKGDGVPVRFKDIIAHIENHLHTSPVFTRRLLRVPLELDYPYWVNDEYFDIEHHIHHGRLPEPGDWRQFCIHLARYHSRPMDMQRPLWEMYVIDGLDDIGGVPKGSYAIATKIHHCTIDGASAVKFFAAFSEMDAKGTPALDTPAVDMSGFSKPSAVDITRRAMISNIRSPVRMAETLLRTAPALLQGVRKSMRPRVSSEKVEVPDTRFNVPVSPHKMFDATGFSLDDFKQIRKAVDGATVNDVVLAVCSGGLRRYLSAHRELPEESLVAWCPINARTKGSSEDSTPGNNITAMTAQIHTDVDDPLECLRAVHVDVLDR